MVGFGRIAVGAIALVVGASLGAMAQQATPSQPMVSTVIPPEGSPGRVPLGHVAGAVGLNLPFDVPNPLHGSQDAVEAGKQLFIRMNCAGCHGYGAKGNMGPNLIDKYWRYGGTPVQVFNSIYDGRPQGMPAWGAKLSSNEIWMLVAYIQSLGGTFPAGSYHQAMQGDIKGEIQAPEVAAGEHTSPTQPAATPAFSSSGSSAKPAVYTTAQATQGASVFANHCANCHGQNLEGKAGPALKGPSFQQMVSAQGLNGASLLAFISQHMPLTNPGALDKTQYADVTAYILKENGYPAGSTTLSPTESNLKKADFSASPSAQSSPEASSSSSSGSSR